MNTPNQQAPYLTIRADEVGMSMEGYMVQSDWLVGIVGNTAETLLQCIADDSSKDDNTKMNEGQRLSIVLMAEIKEAYERVFEPEQDDEDEEEEE